MTKEKILEFEISGFCSNCKRYGTVFYNYKYEKYYCKNCMKVRAYDFTLREVKE